MQLRRLRLRLRRAVSDDNNSAEARDPDPRPLLLGVPEERTFIRGGRLWWCSIDAAVEQAPKLAVPLNVLKQPKLS